MVGLRFSIHPFQAVPNKQMTFLFSSHTHTLTRTLTRAHTCTHARTHTHTLALPLLVPLQLTRFMTFQAREGERKTRKKEERETERERKKTFNVALFNGELLTIFPGAGFVTVFGLVGNALLRQLSSHFLIKMHSFVLPGCKPFFINITLLAFTYSKILHLP